MSTLRRLLENNGVPTRDGAHPEFKVNCWKCGDTGFHMQVSEDKGWCYCYRRKCIATVKQLCKQFKINFQAAEPASSTVSSLSEKFKQLDAGSEKVKNTTPSVFVDLNFSHPIPFRGKAKTVIGEMAREYLYARGFDDDVIEAYRLRYASAGPYAGRIIIPFFEGGSCVYFQARKFMGPGKKVMSPSSKEFALGAHSWLYNFDMASQYSEVVICEGWASAISAGPNAIAIQGNVASTTQQYKLLETWRQFVILLDSDATKESIALAKSLVSVVPRESVKVVYLDHGDPNDLSNRTGNGLYKLIHYATPFNELEARRILCAKL